MNGKFKCPSGRLPGALPLWSVLLLLWPAFTFAAEPLLAIDEMESVGGELILSYRISGLFDAETRAALDSGLPATLLLRWRLCRQREAWSDKRLSGGSAFYRIFHDVLEETYEVFNDRGRQVLRTQQFDDVLQILCESGRISIPLPPGLRDDRLYYVELELKLQPLDSSQIRDLEGWLGGGDDDNGSLLTGVSRYTEKVLKKMVGMDSRHARARSNLFPGED